MKESYFAECIEKFHELPDELQELIGGLDASLKVKKIEDAYNVSLSFVTILVAIGEMTIDDLPDYLYLKFSIDKIKGKEIANHLEEEIFAPVLDLIIESIPEEGENNVRGLSNSIMDLPAPEKKELIIKTFTSEIVPALLADPRKLQDFNVALFQSFNEDEELGEKLENLLYNNQEKLSEHRLIIDGHPASPSIANWLKDFIKKYGSDIFNEVVLAEYLSSAPNIELIKPEEKELVRKVLKLYRNLVFFPESMNGVPLDQWEIFPVDRTKVDSIRDVLEDRKIVATEIAPEVIESSVELPVQEVEENPEFTNRQKIIFDLQKSLTRYPASSLEYKAIHQEINRLSHK